MFNSIRPRGAKFCSEGFCLSNLELFYLSQALPRKSKKKFSFFFSFSLLLVAVNLAGKAVAIYIFASSSSAITVCFVPFLTD